MTAVMCSGDGEGEEAVNVLVDETSFTLMESKPESLAWSDYAITTP